MHRFVFSEEFHEVSMLVLFPVAIWGVWYFMWFVFVWLFGYERADLDDVYQRINILARSYCCLLTSVHYSAFVELWYRMVLHFLCSFHMPKLLNPSKSMKKNVAMDTNIWPWAYAVAQNVQRNGWNMNVHVAM